VLVVEDNEDAGATLVDLLSLGGHEVTLVTTGEAAIRETLARRPSVLICDVGLPDMSGHEVIRAIRAAPGAPPVFAVAVTGYAQPQDRTAPLSAGFDQHLAKPPAVEDLLTILSEVASHAPAR
jgi:CheY-like chemotaxis protein